MEIGKERKDMFFLKIWCLIENLFLHFISLTLSAYKILFLDMRLYGVEAWFSDIVDPIEVEKKEFERLYKKNYKE